MSIELLHPDFKLNGFSHSRKSLKRAADDFVNEGEPHERAIGGFLLKWLNDSAVLLVQTSGSTGMPKEIELQKQHMVNSARATGTFFDLHPSDSALLCLPAGYIAGKMMLVRAMILGLHLDYVRPDSDPMNGLEKTYDFAAMVPLQVEKSLDRLDAIKTLIIGGAKVSYALQQKLQTVECKVFETYGMTETVTHVALRKMNSNVGTADDPSLFKALPNITLSKDNRDCLVINAPAITNKPVCTNDIVNLRSETEFELLGRFDNVINSGGVKLHPEQIEEKLAAVLSERFFVTALPDELLGQKLVLVLEGTVDKNRFLDLDDISNLLDRYEMPKEVFVLPEFVRTNNGKLNRTATTSLINS